MTERERELLETTSDRIESADAQCLIGQLEGAGLHSPMALALVRRWLKTYWSKGWAAAGGPTGAPEFAFPPKKRPRKAKP